ncbi:hypothetical protein [Pseudoalteromonas maricaloris]|uniref:hypothetical protein n=1 Tax=Pseudoalteromonas maricaloris TaxID=184924 RepID=UPI003C1D6C8C
MIQSIEYWQRDLAKVAHKLLMRVIQRQWREASYYLLEKELFTGFFAARKLLECGDFKDSCHNKKYKVIELPFSNKELRSEKEQQIAIEKGKAVGLTARELSNQFIHSYYFTPVSLDGILIGFVISSDFKRKSGIYFITTFEVVELFKNVAGKNGVSD